MQEVTIAKFVAGPLETNAYVVTVKGGVASVIVDPSLGCREVVRHCRDNKLEVGGIVLTHGHFDHIMGIPEIQKEWDVPVYVHRTERALVCQSGLNGSDMLGMSYFYAGPLSNLEEPEMTIGGVHMGIIHVPGHSPGGVVLRFDGQVIVGDVLFAGSVGRADLPGGDFELLIDGIKQKLLTLPADTVVWPGHGNRTTIGREARMNPFLTD